MTFKTCIGIFCAYQNKIYTFFDIIRECMIEYFSIGLAGYYCSVDFSVS